MQAMPGLLLLIRRYLLILSPTGEMLFVEEKPPSAGRLGRVEIHPKTAYSYQADEFVLWLRLQCTAE
jgi:hypothetical protein